MSVAYIGFKSRTENSRKTKIGTEVPTSHMTRSQGAGHIVAASHTACYYVSAELPVNLKRQLGAPGTTDLHATFLEAAREKDGVSRK